MNKKLREKIRIHGAWGIYYTLLLCLTIVLTGCSANGGEQITQMDERYLTEQGKDNGKGEEENNPSQNSQQQEPSKAESDGKVPVESGKNETEASSSQGNTPSKDREESRAQKRDSAEKSAPASSKKAESNAEKKTALPKKSSKKTSSHVRKSAEKNKKDDAQKKNSRGDDQGTEQKKDDNSITCYISIDCKNILSHMSQLKDSKKEFVPEDGMILKETKVTVTKGTSVYDVLYQVCRDRKIHLEAAYTPMYKSYYVEGINQLYEFDCGSLSGWNYTVNGVQSNYGCSKYQVKEGDVICWRFTCDRGKDV